MQRPPSRQFFACLFPLLLFVFIAAASADDSLDVLPAKIDDQPTGLMMPRYTKTKMREALARRKTTYEQLKTPEQIRAYQKRMRAAFIKQLGGLPERTPLNARVVGKIERDGYRIEKVIYESQPGLYVTALLYLPEAKPPYPGVLVPCGHTKNGKAGYQEICILLARNGMAALCYDPLEQGERFQIIDKSGRTKVSSVNAHNYIDVGSIPLGRDAATFFVWDGLRSLDYLVSRPEIDAKRIGCTGNSGGGTLTSYLMALDDRIVCAAPSCYLTDIGRLMDTIGPQDGEQHLCGQLAAGMNHADFIHMRAPRPTLMCTATHDFFDIGGSWETFREAKRLYTRLGLAERVDLVETDEKHGFTTRLRVGAVRWMRRWLMDKHDPITEPKADLLSDEEAWCTPKGRVMWLDGARTTFEVDGEYEARLAKKRRAFWKSAPREEAMAAVRHATGIRPLAELPEPKVKQVGRFERQGYHIERLVFEPEPGIWLPALYFAPDDAKGTACLYLDQRGKAAAVASGQIGKLVKAGRPVLAVDLRGVGETVYAAPTRRKDYAKYMGQGWAEVTLAHMLGTSYLKMRAEDVLMVARYLAERQSSDGRRPVEIIATGVLGPPALHAAALEPELFDTLTLRGVLVSWSEVVREPRARFQLENMVFGVLASYDLPDLVKSLPEGKVKVIDPRRADGKPATTTKPGSSR
jgi:dienelactone hydrolase